jgi:hypothetical protein
VYGEAKARRECARSSPPTATIEGEAFSDTRFFANAGGRGYYVTAVTEQLAAIVKHGWSSSTARARLRRTGRDGGGAPPARRHRVALGFVPTLMADGSPNPVGIATNIINGVRQFLPAKDPAAAKWVRTQFGPLARKLGWKSRKTDTPAMLDLREEVVPFVADLGADPALGKQAVALAKTWRAPEAARAATSVDRGAPPALVDGWREDFVKATDRVTHIDSPSCWPSTIARGSRRRSRDPRSEGRHPRGVRDPQRGAVRSRDPGLGRGVWAIAHPTR